MIKVVNGWFSNFAVLLSYSWGMLKETKTTVIIRAVEEDVSRSLA